MVGTSSWHFLPPTNPFFMCGNPVSSIKKVAVSWPGWHTHDFVLLRKTNSSLMNTGLASTQSCPQLSTGRQWPRGRNCGRSLDKGGDRL